MERVIKTEDLWKVYRSGKLEVTALGGVNFEVFPGEFVGVMGPSGCGKSTLLYVMGGMARASRGRVLVDGNDLTTMNDAERTKLRRHKVGFVFQRFNLLPTLDARGNIAIAQHIHGNGFDPHHFDVITSLLGIKERLHHKPSEMSGGEQQRVAIARAIAKRPDVLLCDEPTGALDYATGVLVLQAIVRINQELGTTAAVITHNAPIAGMADRVMRMADGRIAEVTRNEHKRAPEEITW